MIHLVLKPNDCYHSQSISDLTSKLPKSTIIKLHFYNPVPVNACNITMATVLAKIIREIQNTFFSTNKIYNTVYYQLM